MNRKWLFTSVCFAETDSSNHQSCYTFSSFQLKAFFPLSSTESLYRLRHPRCAPQSSVDGLEDMEVSALIPPPPRLKVTDIRLISELIWIISLNPHYIGAHIRVATGFNFI